MYYQYITLLIAVLYSGQLMASGSDGGGIRLIHSMNNGAVIFYHDGNRTGEFPLCAQN